jgi:hypothetical protein
MKARRHRLMVNAGVVNAVSGDVQLPHFREFFRTSGQFPRFENPVKYIYSSRINGKTVHPAGNGHRHSANFHRHIMHLSSVNALSKHFI